MAAPAGDVMQNEILINAGPGETRVAVLEKGQFAELHIERADARSRVSSQSSLSSDRVRGSPPDSSTSRTSVCA